MTENEIIILKGLEAMGFRWITREQDGFITVSTEKPEKYVVNDYHDWNFSDSCLIDDCATLLDKRFLFIHAQEKEPREISELIKKAAL